MSMNIGLTGLRAANTHLDVASNNIANASTTGFKSGRAEFGDLVDPNAGMTPGLGVRTQAINQQFLQGSQTITGNALDIAINGSGFFAVQDGAGTSYTRAGSFHVDNAGNVVNNLDQKLLNSSGAPIVLASPPVSDIAVDKNGNVTAKNSTGAVITAGPIGLTNFPNVNGLKRVGDTEWAATPEAGTPTVGVPGTGSLGLLSSGALESSNVEITEQLVDVIIAQRDFQANAQTITAGNNMVQTIINIR